MIENATQTPTDSDTHLFLHKLRPQWGPALMVLEEQTRRSYQFQDGQLRKVKKGWYHMMVPFDASEARREILQEDLEAMHQEVQVEQEERQELMAQAPVMSFEDQLRIFLQLYPGGFQDPSYLDTWRTSEQGPTRKRHVDGALAAAQERLGKAALAPLIASGDHDGAMDALLGTLKQTSLAPPARVTRPLEAIAPAHRAEVAAALWALLHGDAPYKDRLRGWILALSDGPALQVNWAMASLPSALLRPKKHTLVKPSVFRLQARILGFGAGVKKRPTPRGYAKARKLVRAACEALEAAGLEPADLIDVRNFVWETLRPSGQSQLKALSRGHAA